MDDLAESVRSAAHHVRNITSNTPPDNSQSGFPPIGQLSVELLVKIFLALDEGEPSTSIYKSGPVVPHVVPIHTEPKVWPVIRLVCSVWDQIACSTPQLWQEICARRDVADLDWLKSSLQRSGNMPINVTVAYNMQPERLIEVLAVLNPHAHRLRMLSLTHSTPGLMTQQHDAAHVLVAFLAKCTSGVLQELRLDCTYNFEIVKHHNDVDYPQALSIPVPVLRFLNVLHIPQPSVLTRNIRILDLRAHPQQIEAEGVNNLLVLLESCQESLEELFLYGMFPRSGTPLVVIRIMHLNLKRLKVLDIRPPETASVDLPSIFQNFVRMPLSASITVLSYGGYYNLHGRYVPFTAFPIFMQATSLRLHLGELWFRCTEPGGGSLVYGVKSKSGPVTEGSYPALEQIKHVCTLLRHAPLNALTLVTSGDGPLDPKLFAQVFKAFSGLDSVEVVTEEGDAGMAVPKAAIHVPRDDVQA